MISKTKSKVKTKTLSKSKVKSKVKSKSKSKPKSLSKSIKKFTSENKVGILGTLGLAAASFFGYKALKNTSIGKRIFSLPENKSIDDTFEYIYNPNSKEKWKGDPGLSRLFLLEFLKSKYNNFCVDDKYIQIQFTVFATVNFLKSDNIANLKNPIETSDIFKDMIKNCSKRFLIIPINIQNVIGIGHANMLIYDKNKNTLEHFDSNGSSVYIHADNVLTKVCDILKIEYLNPQKTCPYFGPQMKEMLCWSKLESVGFCLVWSLWFVELRLKNPDTQSKELISKASSNLGLGICKFIASYAQFIQNLSTKYNIVETNGFVVGFSKK